MLSNEKYIDISENEVVSIVLEILFEEYNTLTWFYPRIFDTNMKDI